MINFFHGDILKANAEALVNTVNCVGVMGRGIALQFKNMFPDNYKAYAAACKKNIVQPGKMFVFDSGKLTTPRYIINFPTKRHWRGKSRIDDIESGVASLVDEVLKRDIKSIAIPPLGSGLGGLDWNEVKKIIVQGFSHLQSVDVQIYEPGLKNEEKSNSSRAVPKMTPGRAALVGLVNRYLCGLMDISISLLEVHKLMYFLQEAGEPLRLKYAKAPYGPYAENLRHVLRDIDGHLLSGYADGGDSPSKQINLVPGAVGDSELFLNEHPTTKTRFELVAKLVDGFESPFGLELLSTVHWAAKHESTNEVAIITEYVHSWGSRKRQFTENQIAIALERLNNKGLC